jgi:hypothetical protein
MLHLFALQNAVSSTAGHTSNVQKLRTVDHVVICASGEREFKKVLQLSKAYSPTFASRHTYSLGLDLETKTAFVLPKRRSDPGLHARGRNLASRVEALWRRIGLPSHDGLVGRRHGR